MYYFYFSSFWDKEKVVQGIWREIVTLLILIDVS